jgi:phospholipase D1/2
MSGSIFKPGHNCWKVKKADHLALLIDGNRYYRAFFDVTSHARHCIEIAGWDLDPKLQLSHIDPKLPDNLRMYFKSLTKKNKKLIISIQVWKAFFYLRFGRERFSKLKWALLTSNRIKFVRAKTPYLFSTYHEKVTIIDNSCAFIGGMDLAGKRWDTSHHLTDNFLRIDQGGNEYFPIHDLQMVISGSVVMDLKKIINNREDAEFDLVMKSGHKLWPKEFPSELDDVNVAILRTDPKVGACEIKQFYLDAIKAAQEYIYIENQYISSDSIIEILCQRLRQEKGPEVVLVVPYSYRGGFERAIYTEARNRVVKKLKASDPFERLSINYPKLRDPDCSKYMIVHSKLLIVDGRLMTMGSANLNNRSLLVDNEINLALESLEENHKVGHFIKGVLSRLLAEHLDIEEQDFNVEFSIQKSLLKTIQRFQGQRTKTLQAIPIAKLTLSERVMTLLGDFVDIKFTILRFYLYIIMIFLIAFLILGFR